MEKHCLVRLNSSTAMLIGGYNREEGGYRNTFFYDFNSETFTKGPDSLEHRENHACGVIRDTGDGSMIVVAVGGSSHTSSSSELFFEGKLQTCDWNVNDNDGNVNTFRNRRMDNWTWDTKPSNLQTRRNHSCWRRAIYCRWRRVLGWHGSWALVQCAVWVTVHKQSLRMDPDGTEAHVWSSRSCAHVDSRFPCLLWAA